MEEKVIKGKKIGFLMLILLVALYVAAFVGLLVCASLGEGEDPAFPGLFGLCVVFLCFGWILILGRGYGCRYSDGSQCRYQNLWRDMGQWNQRGTPESRGRLYH